MHGKLVYVTSGSKTNFALGYVEELNVKEDIGKQ